MARIHCAIGFWLVLTAAAQASCTTEQVAGLQARGVSPQLIAKMCGGASAAGSTEPTSNVCATHLGVCAYHGPINSNCTCPSPNGPVPGTGR